MCQVEIGNVSSSRMIAALQLSGERGERATSSSRPRSRLDLDADAGLLGAAPIWSRLIPVTLI